MGPEGDGGLVGRLIRWGGRMHTQHRIQVMGVLETRIVCGGRTQTQHRLFLSRKKQAAWMLQGVRFMTPHCA